MSNFQTTILDLMAIKKPCIQIRTNLEKEVYPTLLNILYSNQIDNVYRIDELDRVEKITINSKGEIVKQPVEDPDTGMPVQFNPMALLPWVRNIINDDSKVESNAFIFMDYDSKFDNALFRRWIKDIFEVRNKNYAPFIFISSQPTIPDDLNHLFSVVYYNTPDKNEIQQFLTDYESIKKVSISNKEELSNKFIGFSKSDILECLDYTFHKYGQIDDSYIKTKRIETIQKSNVLRYREPRVAMNDMAGNQYFKDWYNEIKYCFEPDAKDYNIPLVKGYLAVGPAGTSKSLSAEMIATDLNIPLISLDLSAIMSKWVGSSEQNIDQAITTIKQLAPCVLLIDEVEKNLGGATESSNQSDSGTLARVFGKILNLLADNDNGIFTVMTSNDARKLPPELTRAGRLDTIWYMNLPTEEEREAIFKLHLEKRNHKVAKTTLKKIAKETKNYTGAEIEQIVISAIRKAFVKMKKQNKKELKITLDELLDAKNNVIPVAVTNKETIAALEDWAKGRALYSNKPTNSSNKKSVLDKLDDLDIDIDDII